MKRTDGRAARVLFTALAVIVMTAVNTYGIEKRIVKVGEKDSGSVVEVAAGSTLKVILAGNPTTGYNWEVSSLDSAILRLAGQSFRPDRKLIGSGGKETLTFKAVAPGRTVIRLIYHRSFERNMPPARTYELTVIVRPDH
jgi:inhibitor of cysteine peptidase